MSDDPCRWCSDYPYWCRGRCKEKDNYINEVDEDVPVVTATGRIGVIIDINKNGIRREITYAYNRRQSKRNKRRRATRSI
ncbi:MAG: hypothetical protein J6F30_13135 [Cellulosilyticum sp.]|nr:hypothetical protein [Cellulosilyticum sp.]